jgi:membrane associated rhomboid family serine protease
MEEPVEVQDHLKQGNTLFWQGQAREAAVAYARAVQLAPNLAAGHLGLAQANLALGSYGLVHMACQRVQELSPIGSEAALASAVLFVLDRRYDRALEAAEQVIAADPSLAYAHALRGYCLRQLGREYEASLAEARAARIEGNADFRALFPQVGPSPQAPGAPTAAEQSRPAPRQKEWRPPSKLRRQIIWFRFTTRQYSLAMTTLIIVNVALFLSFYLFPSFYLQTLGFGFLILQGDYWRIFIAPFINLSWLNLLFNMFFLYFIGRWVEQLYGPGRSLLIYVGSGILGGLLTLLVAQDVAFISAATAVMGVFGALGAFLWQKGYAIGLTLGSWLFWLILNLALGFGLGGLFLPAEMGGLAVGLLLGLVLLPGFWTPVRVRLKRGQKGQALTYALKPILLILAIDAGLMLLSALLVHGPIR